MRCERVVKVAGTEPAQGIAAMLQVRLTSCATCFTYWAGTVLDINQFLGEDE